ncbi:PIR Superfamily Protein [Plasmodium ovale wallikeri]|uniref:PIR Superfamily Protein n=1 Tax=Plasmodium ovale wallikeri TaxID=864142 RepID=A0A1A9AGW3_PLAOA|nr:PIR Superfamily Protein [Plasmodium ovale wallikeri]
MENRFNVLKSNLESFNFDLMLNNPVTSCPKCSLCDKAKGNNTDEPWFKFFCYQLVRNLETAETINSNSKDTIKSRCKSLIYWMYDKVINTYKRSGIIEDEKIIKDLLDVWEKFNNTPVKNANPYSCEVPDVSEFNNIEEMKKKKTMSDYCENYNTFKKILNYDEYLDCHVYYDYFKDSLSKYKETVKVCSPGDFFFNNCSRFCSKEDPEDVLNKSKCRTIEISPKKNDYMKKDECKALTNPAPEVRCQPNEIKITEFTLSDNRAIILILLSLWGVFLTFIFLYKMTPFKSWISNKLGKRNIIQDRFNDQSDDEALDVDYESTDRNMQNAEYIVSYNSDWKSSR